MQIENIDENLSMNISDTSGASLQVSDVDTSLEMNVDNNKDIITLNIINEEGNVGMEVETGGSKVEGTTDHSKLQNLDYEHSGHTGFQRKGDYVEDSNYVHTDNNFTDTEKTKLESLSNYDDTLIKKDILSNTSQINALKTSVTDLDTNKADKTEIPNVSNFITNTVDNLVNYYLKSELYTKEEINELASTIQTVNIKVVDSLPIEGQSNIIYFVPKNGSTNDIYDEWIYINSSWEHIGSTEIDLTGYATENWVKLQIGDFLNSTQVNNLINSSLSNYYNKSEVDAKINEIPIAPSYTADDNVVIENDVIKGYTNTGYIVSDTDIKLQAISEVETTAETVDNKIVYTYDEVVIIYDGTNYIRRSENGIDFEVIELPYNCKNMIYHTVRKRLIATNCNGYFMYSDDNGKTWTAQASSFATSNTYLFQQNTFSNGFAVIDISTKKIITINDDFTFNNTLTSTIVPNYICLLNSSQFIWCNNIGGFKYGAGSKEGIFPSLAGVSVSLLKNVNDKVIVGLNNNNKLYILSQNTVSGSSWVAYNLPKQCTVNDIIYNSNDSTYYILTSINTYYKTTDFVNFVSVDKDSLRGVQGYFTLAGIQATTTNNNKLLLAPTRIKIENMLQKFKRLTDFNKLLGDGLEKKSEEQIGVKVRSPLNVSTTGVSLTGESIDYTYLTNDIVKILRVAEAPIVTLSPAELEDYVWTNWDGSNDFVFKLMFTEAGTFYDFMSYEEEYTVEKYELGYIFITDNGMRAPYTSMGKFSVFFQ